MKKALILSAAAFLAGCSRLALDEARYRLIEGVGLHAGALTAALQSSPDELTPGERKVLESFQSTPGVLATAYLGPDGHVRYAPQEDQEGLPFDQWLAQRGFGARAAAAAYDYRRPAVQCPRSSACDLAYPLIAEGRFEGLVLVQIQPGIFDSRGFIEAQKSLP